jgi:hypothetical protein
MRARDSPLIGDVDEKEKDLPLAESPAMVYNADRKNSR